MDFKKFFTKKNKETVAIFKKYRLERSPNPVRHWHIVLGSFFVLLIVTIGISIFIFFTLSNDQFFAKAPPVPASPEKIAREKLTGALQFFTDRKANFDQYNSGGSVVVDPSH